MTSIAPVAHAPAPASASAKASASGGSDFARVLDSAERDHQGSANAHKVDDAAVTQQDSAGPGAPPAGEATQAAAVLTDVALTEAELAALAALVADTEAADGANAVDAEAAPAATDAADAPAAAIALVAGAPISSTDADGEGDLAASTSKPAAAITPSSAAAASGLAGSPSPSTASPAPPTVSAGVDSGMGNASGTAASSASVAPAAGAADALVPGAATATGQATGTAAEGASTPVASTATDGSARVATAEPATAVAAPAAPTPAPASAPAAPVHHASPAQPPAPLATQLSGQLMSLRQLPQGDHVMTLTVNPETFGPVRVVAHISADGLHLELFGASEQARAALRAALPDLRRDLAGAGLDSRLDLGSEHNTDGRQQSALGDSSEFGRRPSRATSTVGAASSATGASATSPSTSRSAHAGAIDVDL